MRAPALVTVLAASVHAGFPVARADDPCYTGFIPSDGFRGVHGVVYGSTVWDPDGFGPRTPVLVIVGTFDYAGTLHTNNIAVYDPATGKWEALGNGIGYPGSTLIYKATVLSNGDLVVGGGFNIANGAVANSVARWDVSTSSWQQLGNGITDGFVTALTPLANGGLVAGGNFYTLNGSPAGHIARWDGTSWSNMNGGVSAPSSVQVFSLTTLANGDVIAGGLFASAGGSPAQNIARWSPAGGPGGTWSALGSGADGLVTALAPLANNDFVAGGSFQHIAGNAIPGIARFATAGGGTWSGFGTGISGGVAAINPLANGDMLVGGYFNAAGGNPAPNIAKWTAASSSWDTVGGGTNSVVRSISVFSNGNFAACGDMTQINGLPGFGVQIWNGTAWLNWPGFGSQVRAVASLPNGDVVAAGYFETAGVGSAKHIARRTGTTWSPIGAGITGSPAALVGLPDNGFIVGGSISMAGNTPVSNIASCSSAGSWTALGGGIDGEVLALCRTSGGDIIAGGFFGSPGANVARWNGIAWSPLGDGPGGGVNALIELPNGNIVAGGDFYLDGGAVGNRIALWDGESWSPIGEGFDNEVRALAVLNNGDLIAGGSFESSGETEVRYIARWDGAAWQPLDGGTSGSVYALATLSGGDLIVAGEFSNAGPGYSLGIARWAGGAWQYMDSGVGGSVYALAAAPGNALHLGGSFLGVGSGPFDGGFSSPYFADWKGGGFSITQQPAPASNCPTGIATFTFGVSGGGSVSYEWFLNDFPVDADLNPTAHEATLVLDHPTIDNAGTYYCYVTSDCGTLTSDPAELTIETCCPADFNFDGLVDDTDFVIFVIAYDELLCPEPPDPCPCDLNLDGIVEDADFSIFVAAYNALLCP